MNSHHKKYLSNDLFPCENAGCTNYFNVNSKYAGLCVACKNNQLCEYCNSNSGRLRLDGVYSCDKCKKKGCKSGSN